MKLLKIFVNNNAIVDVFSDNNNEIVKILIINNNEMLQIFLNIIRLKRKSLFS